MGENLQLRRVVLGGGTVPLYKVNVGRVAWVEKMGRDVFVQSWENHGKNSIEHRSNR